MYIYILIFTLLLSVSFAEAYTINDSRKKDIMSIFFLCIVFATCIIAGTRWNIGFDFETYQSNFSDFYWGMSLFEKIQFEPGFILFNILMPSFQISLFVLALISITLKMVFVYKVSPYPILSLYIYFLTYFFLGDMGQIRQSIAIALIFMALLNRTKKIFYVYWIIAVFFHYSAFLAIFFKLIPSKLGKANRYLLLLLIALLSSFVLKLSIEGIISLLPPIVGWKVSFYLLESEDLNGISPIQMLLKFSILFLLYRYKDKIMADKNIPYYYNAYFFSVLIYLAFNFLPEIGGRGSLYFSLLDIVLVPYLIYCIKNQLNKILAIAFYCLLYFALFIRFWMEFGTEFTPYQSWLLDLFI